MLVVHKHGCGWPQVSEILCHLKWFSEPGVSWLLLCEWVTHSWHGSLSSDSTHWGSWACLLIWESAHTKISLNFRASAGQEERGPVIRGARLLQCSQRATELPRHQTQDYFAELRTMRAVPLWPPSTSPFMMMCLQWIFLKKKYPHSNKTYFINCFLFMTRWTGVFCFSILCPEEKLARK